MKRIFTLGITLLLCACSLSDSSQSAIPAEFAGADYQLSDKNAKQWAIASKQAEQCIYPNLTRIQQQHFAKEDSYIHSQYVFFYPLENIIGEDYVKIIQNDEKSMNYATYQFKKFRTIVGNAEPMDNQQCRILRTQARDDLDVVKGQYKNGMVDNSKIEENTTNGDGVATNQNKFFFDIIKWGSALLL
ncbi:MULTISPECIES: DUF5358 domain-containing protein [Pasteurellaceae]|uniref:DUF5358 domain-containing protein n=1 Tax=Rodentibacter genomosp. 1 TaxID=1908264 RepID=A0A1V3J337_9PAST|nr:DUF5358 domain-containing protein [Rodentibacter genomosp. 1]MBF0750765.1 DUF5358 domain-containing protein [Pasteurella sp. 19428wF3_WM03]OOF49189.1 hypothetical protein BKK54_09730 [Rodentibacter genomosp. 1]TFU53035.1 hypothetical protein E4T92_01125 [Pasteurella sp. WM03]